MRHFAIGAQVTPQMKVRAPDQPHGVQALVRPIQQARTGADRAIAARPGSKVYGVPSVKAAWYADVALAGTVSRSIFWPVPNVDSGLVRLVRREPPQTSARREDVFSCIDAAFAQRRKTLRAALSGWAGSAPEAERCLVAAGIDPRTRGEQLGIEEFAAIAAARAAG